MIKKNILNLLLCFATLQLTAQAIIEDTRKQVLSPDGDYAFTFYQKQFPNNSRQMYYSLSYKGKEVIRESELGVLIENHLFESALGIPNDTLKLWGDNLELIGEEVSQTDKTWVPVYGQRDIIRDNYNELKLHFRKGNAEKGKMEDNYNKRRFYFMDFEVHVYNEGVAFRYHFPEASNGLFLHIIGEQTQFAMPEGTQVFYAKWAQDHYRKLPLNALPDESERPLTMRLANGLTVALAEAQMVDYARGKFRLNPQNRNTLQLSIYSSADVITPYDTPWRVIMVGEKAIDLIANQSIILNLNPENRIKDASWIKPGKAIRSNLSQADAKACIDFAAERGLQYVHLDAGWYGPEMSVKSDASKVRPDKDIDLPALANYAAGKGIGIFVYVNQRALYNQLDTILPLYKKWGIKGIKFGFVQTGNQYWTTWLHEAVKKCAKYEILVDIHDEYRPTGFSRTYPNLLTQEGVCGNEEMPDATHNTILPFTRFLAGPADYTICYYNNRIKTTHAHQLAMAVVYYSPLQFLYWYDQPSAYQGEPEVEFFDKVKTVWDETKIIDGEIGEFVTIARRADKEWFLGTLGNNDFRNIATPLSFLLSGQKYVANIYTDDDKVQTKTLVRVTRLIVDAETILRFQLKPSGGCAVHFLPATKEDLKKYKRYNNGRI